MKKQIVLGLAFMIGAISFGQKKEMKAAEKAIKSNNYADANKIIMRFFDKHTHVCKCSTCEIQIACLK